MATAFHLEALRKQRVLDRAAAARKEQEQACHPHRHHHHHHHHHHHQKQQTKRSRPTSAQITATADSKKSRDSVSCPPSAPPSRPFNPSPEVMDDAEEDKKGSLALTPSLPPTSLSQSRHSSASVHSAQSGIQQLSPHPLSTSPPMKTDSPLPDNMEPGNASVLSMYTANGGSKGHTPSMHDGSNSVGSSRCRSSCSCSCSCRTGECSRCSGSRVGTASARAGDSKSGSRTMTTSGQARSSKSGSRASLMSGSAAEARADSIRKELKKQEYVLRDSNLVMGNITVEEEIQLKKQEESS